jgi:hypothetical protein
VAVVAGLADLRIKVKIGEWPNEVPDPIRFGEDRTHAAYDPEYARRFWRILLQVDRIRLTHLRNHRPRLQPPLLDELLKLVGAVIRRRG